MVRRQRLPTVNRPILALVLSSYAAMPFALSESQPLPHARDGAAAAPPTTTTAVSPPAPASLPTTPVAVSPPPPASSPTATAAFSPPPPTPVQDQPRSARPLVPDCTSDRPFILLTADRWLEAHFVAESLLALCAPSELAPMWRLANATALVHLDEGAWARQLLAEEIRLVQPARANIIAAWSLFRDGDNHAFLQSLKTLNPRTRLRLTLWSDPEVSLHQPLDIAIDDTQLRRWQQSLQQQVKAPWLAGSLSAVLPGAGQAYAGSWEAAAIALVLNGLMIGTTWEFFSNEQYWAGATSATLGSVFYVGNIMNAVDLARRRNERARVPAQNAWDRLLLPEVFSW